MTYQLLNCPFCNGSAELVLHAPETWARCTQCNASTDTTSDYDRAADKWNKRAAGKWAYRNNGDDDWQISINEPEICYEKLELSVALAASPPPPAAQGGEWAVKPLEWVRTGEARSWSAKSILGTYRALEAHPEEPKIISPSWSSGDGWIKCSSFEDAKSAAQADYEQRIRSALVPPTTSADAVAWVAWDGSSVEALIEQYANGAYIGQISKPPISIYRQHFKEFADRLLTLANDEAPATLAALEEEAARLRLENSRFENALRHSAICFHRGAQSTDPDLQAEKDVERARRGDGSYARAALDADT